MKTAIALSIIALGTALTLQGAAASGNGRDDLGRDTLVPDASLRTASQGHDLSAARKKRKSVYVHPAEYGYYYPQAFAPGDPSWQSPDMLRRRAIGECIIDLGYGRWESCSNAGRGGR